MSNVLIATIAWFESFPDSEGIKTPVICSPREVILFESFPDSEGIKTVPVFAVWFHYLFESFPDSEGIKTKATAYASIHTV